MTYFINKVPKINQYTKTVNDKFYIDKSVLIDKTNTLIGSPSQFLCVTRPRRFGKTINAMMLECYYSKNADFKNIFDNLNISKFDSYEKHLNKHNVVYLQLNELPNYSKNVTYDDFISRYEKLLFEDIQELWPNINIDKNNTLSDVLNKISSETG